MYICICIWIYVYMCMYICINISHTTYIYPFDSGVVDPESHRYIYAHI